MNVTNPQLPFARILRDSLLELFLTFLMLFGVVSIVRWVIGPSPISRMIPEIHAELLIVGVAVAILIAGLIMSPPGRMTGGHMNPAISLAMWRFGVFPGVGVVPYIIAQLLGSVLGGVAARVVWGPVVAAGACCLRGATARTGLVDRDTFHGGNRQHGDHRSAGRLLSGSSPACPACPLDCRWSDRDRDCGARYLHGGQRESGSPIWAGYAFGPDKFSLGVFVCPDGGSATCRMAAGDYSTTSRGTNT